MKIKGSSPSVHCLLDLINFRYMWSLVSHLNYANS